MMKRMISFALALVMLIMPMTASAVTWGTLMEALNTSGSYSDGYTTAKKEDKNVTVSGGSVINIYIDEAGNYVFNGVSIEGHYMVIDASGEIIKVALDKDTKFNTDTYGLDIYVEDNGHVLVDNDSTIVGNEDSLYIVVSDEKSQVTVSGDGTIKTNKEGNEYLADSPVYIYSQNQDVASLIKNQIHITQKIDATGNTQPIYLVAVDPENFTANQYVISDIGDLYMVNEDGSTTLVERNVLGLYDSRTQAEIIEEKRQAEGIGNVTTSPVWCKQGYLGHSSKPMWIYIHGERENIRQRLFWNDDGTATKNHTCRVNVANFTAADVEIRIGLDMLRTALRAEISVITVLDKQSNPIAQFDVADMMAVCEMYEIGEEELLCISGDPDAEVMMVTANGEYVPLDPSTEAVEG